MRTNFIQSTGGYSHNRRLAYRVDVLITDNVSFLGSHSGGDLFLSDMHYKANAWCPKGYQSYDIVDFHHTTYEGLPVHEATGHIMFIVLYRRSKRGRFQFDPDYVEKFLWEPIRKTRK